jgi:PEP-CTERM motif
MKTPRASLRHLAALTLLAGSACAQAGFDGKSFSGYYTYPDLGTAYASSTPSPFLFTVGNGVDAQFLVEGVTTISVDFSDTQMSLVLNTTLPSPTWNVAAFNGFTFDVTAGGPLSFSALSIDPLTSMAGFTAGRVGLTDSRVRIDWNGLSYVDGTRVVVNFVSAVPEPGTYALLLAGLGAVALAARRRRLQI